MTDERNPLGEREDLAAEYALGLLTGDELDRARALERSDPAFRALVERWAGQLAPMLDSVDPVEPPASAWSAIEGELDRAETKGSVIALTRRLNRWRGLATGMTALAASLAVFVAVRPSQPPPVVTAISPSPPMVAMLSDQQQSAKVVASWDPSTRQLVLAIAGDMPVSADHSHELWVIPAGGKPRSLGTMPTTKQMHMRLTQSLAELLKEGATVAISLEPRGGSPTGAPTGPVVAAGQLAQA